MCEYDKLLETNIKEREEAMEASQFFENLDSYKVKIGIKKGKNGLEQQTDKNND